MDAEEYQDILEEESGIAQEAVEEMLAKLYDSFGILPLRSTEEFLQALDEYCEKGLNNGS